MLTSEQNQKQNSPIAPYDNVQSHWILLMNFHILRSNQGITWIIRALCDVAKLVKGKPRQNRSSHSNNLELQQKRKSEQGIAQI